jgi:hypothetical protein
VPVTVPLEVGMVMSPAACRAVVEAHARDGGCTWSVARGDLGGTPGYAVGQHTRAVAVYCRNITADMILDGWEFIGRPDTFGTWFHASKGRSTMERVTLCQTMEFAMLEARAQGDLFVFDLADRVWVSVR